MSSRRYSPESQCYGKQIFGDQPEAARLAAAASEACGKMVAYRCPHSGDVPHWHVGHKLNKADKAMLRRRTRARQRWAP